MNHAHLTQNTKRFRWKWIVALAGFLAVAAFFLFSEHRAHFFGFLPFLLLLLCPIFHLFMHGGGHGGGSHQHNDKS
jgi:uncharacterized membrane protein